MVYKTENLRLQIYATGGGEGACVPHLVLYCLFSNSHDIAKRIQRTPKSYFRVDIILERTKMVVKGSF